VTDRELMEARRALISSADWARQKFAITRAMSLEERMHEAEEEFRGAALMELQADDARRERVRAVFNRLAPGAEESLRRLSELHWPGPPRR